MRKRDSFLLTLGLTVFVVAPLLYPGYFQTHTGLLPLWSVSSLKQNPFNPLWIPPLRPFDPWRSEGLLPYYLAALLPLSPLNGVKGVLGLAALAGSSGLYLWLKGWLGGRGAAVAALTYAFAPFTVAALYVRGAIGETFFWGLLPWALLSATYLVARPTFPVGLVAFLFWGALGLSQLGLSVWAYVLLAAMLVCFHRPQARSPLLAAAMGLLAAALITLPRAASPLPAAPADHLLYPAQLLISFWSYGVSRPGWDDGMSFSLGFAALGLATLSVAVWRGGPDRRPWFFVGVVAAAALLAMPPLGYLWQIPLLARTLRYPWQMLGFAALGLSVLAGVSLWQKEELRQLPAFAALLTVVLLAMYPNLEPQFVADPLPAEPEAIYGDNQIVLLAHAFEVDNPAQGTDLHPVEPYIPLADGGPLSPGDTFYLQVWWQAIEPPAADYKVFAHVVDAAGQVITQVDVQPQGGERPTSTWLPGEWIADRYTFTLPPDGPPPAQVWLGLYHPDTLARLPVAGDAEGRAVLDVR